MSSNAWKKINTVAFTLRLFKTTDADILPYLETENKPGFIKDAIRYYIANGCPEVEKPKKSEED